MGFDERGELTLAQWPVDVNNGGGRALSSNSRTTRWTDAMAVTKDTFS